MALYNVKVEGIYESDKGSGQKEYVPFNFEIKVARFKQAGVETHILRRYIPLLCKQNKKMFSRVKNFNIVDIQKLNDSFPLENKDIKTFNEKEIQDLATMYDLYEIPLPSTMSITQMREVAITTYLKNVCKVPMDTPEEKAVLDIFEQQADGSYQLNVEDNSYPVVVNNDYAEKEITDTPKKSIADYIKNAGKTIAEGVLAITGNNVNGEAGGNNNNGMPTPEQLLGK